MIITWEQKLHRATQAFVNNELIDDTQIQTVRRPLFFGKYKWALHFAPRVAFWASFDTVQLGIKKALRGWENRFVSSYSALYFNVYANNPLALHQIQLRVGDQCEFSSLLVIAPECWHLTQPRPKNKGKFYHKYQYRIQIRNPNDLSPSTYSGLMANSWLVTRGFFYCLDVRDVILFKLIHSQDIVSITERD